MRPIIDADPDFTRRVRQVLDTAPRAPTDWRQEWFSTEYWTELKPWLADVAKGSRKRGSARSVTLVARVLESDSGRTLTYRANYGDWNRIVTVKFDAQGRIKNVSGEDE